MSYNVDKLKDAITSTANVVVKKSSELYERSKITLSITSLQNEIDKIYMEIGKLVYEGNKEEDLSLDLVQEKCDLVDEKMQQLKELRAERASVKNVKICPACNAEVSPESTYCANCGEKF